MPSKRTLLGGLAFSVALAGGGVAGVALGSPGTSGAQDTTSTTVASHTPAHPGRALARHPRLEVLRVAAQTLGMKPADLAKELRSGKSIADVAKEKGIDESKVVDAIVNDATNKLNAEIAQLPTQVTKAVEHEGGARRPAPASSAN